MLEGPRVHLFEDSADKFMGNVSIDKLASESERRNARYYADSLKSLIDNKNHELDIDTQGQHKLDSRGYSFVISGPWGVGKTTIANAIINDLRYTRDGVNHDIIHVNKTLLPFGNVSESISILLSHVADELSTRNIVDIHKEIKQFIMEVTPEVDTANISANLGGIFSIEKSLKSKSYDIKNKEDLNKKMQKLVSKGKTLIILIDDLDRLRPDEVTPILRMVEKLRDLPRVIVVLPIFNSIVNNAISKDLQIPDTSASTFLRKLTDVTMYVDNELGVLRDVFIGDIKLHLADMSNEKIFGKDISELCWLILLHVVIIHDTLADYATINNSDISITNYALNAKNSQYIRAIRRKLMQSNSESYPVYDNSTNGEYWVDLKNAPYMKEFTGPTSPPAFEQALDGMINTIGYTSNLVTTDQGIRQQLIGGNRIKFDSTVQADSGSPIFIEFMYEILLDVTYEPAMTNSYRKREMNILASMIGGELRSHPSIISSGGKEDLMWNVFCLVRDQFLNLRG